MADLFRTDVYSSPLNRGHLFIKDKRYFPNGVHLRGVPLYVYIYIYYIDIKPVVSSMKKCGPKAQIVEPGCFPKIVTAFFFGRPPGRLRASLAFFISKAPINYTHITNFLQTLLHHNETMYT